MFGISVVKINVDAKKYKRLYECIESFEEAELLAQLAMSDKDERELIMITPGWNRSIRNNAEEYQKALELAKKYKIEDYKEHKKNE
jgi:hypothetical protein